MSRCPTCAPGSPPCWPRRWPTSPRRSAGSTTSSAGTTGRSSSSPRWAWSSGAAKALWSARVLLYQGTEVGERGRDVLGGAAAHGLVGLHDHGPVGDRAVGIAHGEQGLGHLVASLDQVVAEPGGTGGTEVRPERLKLDHHLRDQLLHLALEVTRREGVRRLVRDLDRGAGDPGLGGDLLLDQLLAVVDYLRLRVGREQDFLERGGHVGSSLLPWGRTTVAHAAVPRLGSSAECHPSVHRYTPGYAAPRPATLLP